MDGYYNSICLECFKPSTVRDKTKRILEYVLYMLDRTQRIFEYRGLPDTIPQRMLELQLQQNGFTIFTEHESKLYCFYAGLGGEPDVYYRPTKAVIANPALKYNATLDIGRDCVIALNDSMLVGLMPLYYRYAEQLVENDLTIYIADINSRITSLLSSSDDTAYKAAVEYLEKVQRGELGVIADSAFLEGVKTQPYASPGMSNQLTQLIELQQYLKASWFNEIGLQSNFNMKREAINSGEAALNEQALLPLVDDMLECRRQALKEVNEKYGLNVTVELSSSWEVQHNEMSMSHNDTDIGDEIPDDRKEADEKEEKDNEEDTPPD